MIAERHPCRAAVASHLPLRRSGSSILQRRRDATSALGTKVDENGQLAVPSNCATGYLRFPGRAVGIGIGRPGSRRRLIPVGWSCALPRVVTTAISAECDVGSDDRWLPQNLSHA